LQLRASCKELHPNTWDVAAAGHLGNGEEPIIAAIRETQEEIGLTIKKEDLEFVKIIKISGRDRAIINKEFYYVYLLNFEGDVNQLTMQEEEVAALEFLPVEQVEKELKEHSNKYIPHGQYWFDMLEEIKKKL